MDEKDNLNSFLKLGYFLNYNNPNISFDLSLVAEEKEKMKHLNRSEKILLLQKKWFQLFEKLFSSEDNIIPLSGGRDSRAILASLLEFSSASDLYTYTFGTPGTYDYEIGNYIAKRLGTKHESFPLSNYKFSTVGEIEISKRIDHQTFLFHHPDLSAIDQHYIGKKIWSGAMMDWITGAYNPFDRTSSLCQAKANIIKKNSYAKSISLEESDLSIIPQLTDSALISSEILSFEEQLQVKNFLSKMEAPHILYKGYEFKLPAQHSDFYAFFLSLNSEERHRQNFYSNFLNKQFPHLFGLPLKTFHGLSQKSPTIYLNIRRIKHRIISTVNKFRPIFFNPHTNYIDFNEGIRNRTDLRAVIRENINDLQERRLIDWISIDQIFSKHMNRQGHFADALLLLASLEIHLKAGKEL